MAEYAELIKALRCNQGNGLCPYADCEYKSKNAPICMPTRLTNDAADAIEDLQAVLAQIRWERDVAMEQLEENGISFGAKPKHGEWVEDTTTYAGPGLSNYKCSLCGKIGGTWRRGLKRDELPNFCGNCGADMRAKME